MANQRQDQKARRPRDIEDPAAAVADRRSRELCKSLVEAVRSIEPGGEVILYGSRARNDARPDSDWNLLILVDGPLDDQRKAALRHRLYEIELSTDEVLSPLIYSRRDWASPEYRAMPLHRQVDREGIVLARDDGNAAGAQTVPIRRRRPADPTARKRSFRELRKRIKKAVGSIEPDAQIILYGSRARGDAAADSDWDLLVLVDGPVAPERRDAICHRLYEVEWSSDEVLCPLVRSRQDWDSSLYRAMPFHQNVERDGVFL